MARQADAIGAAAGNPQSSSLPLVLVASSLGTMIEWYDFYIFGSLATVLSVKFYPPGNDTFALIAYLATFAAGFVVRPFGALFFGSIGDRIGRKYTFLLTLSIMGGATALIANTEAQRFMSVSTPLTTSAASTRALSKSRRSWGCAFPCWSYWAHNL